MESVAITNQKIMFFDLDFDVEVAGSPATGAYLSASRKVHAIAVIDTCRNFDLYLASRPHSTISCTFRARRCDPGSKTLARCTWARRHHLSNEGASHLLYFTATFTDIADDGRGTIGTSTSLTAGAKDRGINNKISFTSETSLFKGDTNTNQGILTIARA
jgi:hypothetical protein